jgi:peptidase E
MEAEASVLDDYVLSLAPAREPRICLLPTAGGDSEEQIRRFRIAFGDRLCEPSVVSLFRLELEPLTLREHLLAQDVIYVGGGSLISLLGVWRAHGIDAILREAYDTGIVLCGLSAGSLCWFAEAVSGYHGEVNRVPGLGFLSHSNAVHYCDGERRRAFHRHLLDGMPSGYAAEDGAALRFTQDKLAMRERLTGMGITCPRFAPVRTATEVEAFAAGAWPLVLKAVSGGYDGKGVWVCESAAEAAAVLAHGALLAEAGGLIAEEYVAFDRELAVLAARSPHRRSRSRTESSRETASPLSPGSGCRVFRSTSAARHARRRRPCRPSFLHSARRSRVPTTPRCPRPCRPTAPSRRREWRKSPRR